MAATRALTPSRHRISGIEENIKALLELKGENSMQKTGNIFNGDRLLIDELTGTVYRKEQFFSDDSLPCEYVVRDRRYTIEGIAALVRKAGFIVEDCFCFQSGRINQPLSVNDRRAKEIFLVARKGSPKEKLTAFLSPMPHTWT